MKILTIIDCIAAYVFGAFLTGLFLAWLDGDENKKPESENRKEAILIMVWPMFIGILILWFVFVLPFYAIRDISKIIIKRTQQKNK